jgi:beta-lactamase superfamily II metal-dependent hydrolase
MRRLLSVGSLCLLVVGCYAPEASEEATSENRVLGRFEVAVLDVGQGSAAVVAAPGGCVALLDGGPEGSGPVIKRYLRSLGVTEIAFAVASHYHEDHIGGLDEVEQGADGIRIRTVYDRGGTFQGAAFGRYYRQFADRRATVHAGQTLSLCGEVALEVEAVDAGGRDTTDENARSVVVAARWRAIDVLAGGDLPGAPGTLNMEAQLAPALGPVEAYLVHHHGSRSSSSTELLRAITPQVSIISVGADNTYNHPAPETLARLREAASDVWQTEDPRHADPRRPRAPRLPRRRELHRRPGRAPYGVPGPRRRRRLRHGHHVPRVLQRVAHPAAVRHEHPQPRRGPVRVGRRGGPRRHDVVGRQQPLRAGANARGAAPLRHRAPRLRRGPSRAATELASHGQPD